MVGNEAGVLEKAVMRRRRLKLEILDGRWFEDTMVEKDCT